MQVIWAIGVSMIALAALVWLPRPLLIAFAVVIIAGHNLLDGLHFETGSALHVPWAILHERSWIEVGDSLRLRITYPVLPWIGVIALGYCLGPWFAKSMQPTLRQRYLLLGGVSAWVGFVVVRAANGYGDTPWQAYDNGVQTLMSFFNITKYPPSLLFLALTLGIGLLLLLAFEQAGAKRWISMLATFGAAPMFFYLLHLYVLKILYVVCVALFGLNHGNYFGFDGMGAIWLVALLLPLALYPPVHWFAGLKARRRDLAWLKYL
jgi:uncharacterized membrane protein